MNKRDARKEALYRAAATLRIEAGTGDASDLGEGIEADFGGDDAAKIYREIFAIADALEAQAERLEAKHAKTA